jgi:hypothetical protein
MAALQLTDDETWLARRIAEAGQADFGEGRKRGRPRGVVRAIALRRMLLGLAVRLAGEDDDSIVPVTGPGVRIRSARIEGPLDLDGACASDGSALPQLELRDCVLALPIQLRRARLRRLSLQGSQFPVLHATGIAVHGPVNLSGVGPVKPEKGAAGSGLWTCRVDLHGATIEGSLDTGPAELRNPDGFAMDLRRLTLGGTLWLTPDFKAIGGVALRGAEIGGDLQAEGARLEATQGVAFQGDQLRVAGDATFDCRRIGQERTIRFRANGDLRLCGARIGRSLSLRGAEVRGDIDALDLHVAGSAVFGYRPDGALNRSKAHSLKVRGGIDLGGAKIDAMLIVSDAHIAGKLNFRNLEVGGLIGLGTAGYADPAANMAPMKVMGGINLESATVAGSLSLSGIAVHNGFIALNAVVGGYLHMLPSRGFIGGRAAVIPTTIQGQVILAGARIGGALGLLGVRIRGEVNAQSAEFGEGLVIRAWDGDPAGSDDILPFEIRGDTLLQNVSVANALEVCGGLIRGDLDARNAEIGGAALFQAHDGKRSGTPDTSWLAVEGNLVLDGADIGASLYAEGVNVEKALSAQNARVGGNAFLRSWVDKRTKERMPARVGRGLALAGVRIEGSLEISGARVGGDVDLQGCRVGGHTHLRAWQEPDPTPQDLLPSTIDGSILLIKAQLGDGLDLSGTRVSRNIVLQDAVVGGNIHICGARNRSDTDRDSAIFSVAGFLALNGVQVSGGISGEGAQIGELLSARSIQVGGDVLLGVFQGMHAGKHEAWRFSAGSGVLLRSAVVAGNLDLTSAQIEGDLDAQHARIGGSARLGAGSVFRDDVVQDMPLLIKGDCNLASAKIQGGLFANGSITEGAFRLSNAEIGGPAFLSVFDGAAGDGASPLRFTSKGGLYLQRTRIMGLLYLSGASVLGELRALGMDVGGDVLLTPVRRQIAAGEEIISFQSHRTVDFEGARIAGSVEAFGATFLGALRLNSAIVHGGVHLSAFGNPDESDYRPFEARSGVDLSGARVDGDLRLRNALLRSALLLKSAIVAGDFHIRLVADHVAIREKKQPEIDLRDARVGVLDDNLGRGVGEHVLLRLEGFHYDRMAEADAGEQGRSHPVAARIAAFLSQLSQMPRLMVVLVLGALSSLWLLFRADLAMRPLGWVGISAFCLVLLRIFVSVPRAASPLTPWRQRLAWLALQYPARVPTRDAYRPDPYERMTRAFRGEGAHDDARRIASARLTLERRLRISVAFRPLIWVYALFYDYGLSPRRGIAVFGAFVVLGWGAATVADRGVDAGSLLPSAMHQALSEHGLSSLSIKPALIINTTPVTSVAVVDGHSGQTVPALTRGGAAWSQTSEMACGDQVEPLLYALDAFVPALDLGQQAKCIVSAHPAALAWRLGFAAYSILGWIITSLTILTLSGILRRQTEG